MTEMTTSAAPALDDWTRVKAAIPADANNATLQAAFDAFIASLPARIRTTSDVGDKWVALERLVRLAKETATRGMSTDDELGVADDDTTKRKEPGGDRGSNSDRDREPSEAERLGEEFARGLLRGLSVGNRRRRPYPTHGHHVPFYGPRPDMHLHHHYRGPPPFMMPPCPRSRHMDTFPPMPPPPPPLPAHHAPFPFENYDRPHRLRASEEGRMYHRRGRFGRRHQRMPHFSEDETDWTGPEGPMYH